MEKGAFICYLIITIFQTIIFAKLALLNKTIEEELNGYVEWKFKHNGENILEHYIDRRIKNERIRNVYK